MGSGKERGSQGSREREVETGRGPVGREREERWVLKMVCFSHGCGEVGTIIHSSSVDIVK